MSDRISTPRCGIASAGALALVVATLVTMGPARAEEETTFEQQIMRSLLGGGSGRPDIDYRERSPLVIPPSRELPPPDNGASVQGNAAWPDDPDRRRRSSTAAAPVIDEFERRGRPLSPAEMRRGARAGAGRNEGPAVTLSDGQMGRPLTPAELGETKSLFGMIGRVGRTEPPVTFTREPSRTRLTQPPAGYQTPSNVQPYSPPKGSDSWFKIPSIFDRTTPDKDR